MAKLSTKDIRAGLIRAGMKNLRTFGYPHVNENNILTDMVYRAFFKKMLEDEQNVGKNKDIDKVRLDLITEIDKQEKSRS